MFGIWKKEISDNAADNSTDRGVCKLNGANQECELIGELRVNQEELRKINKYLKSLEEDSPELLNYTIKILLTSERTELSHFIRRYISSYKSYSENVQYFFSMYGGVHAIQQALMNVSIDDIDNMCEELKKLKERGELIYQYIEEKKNTEKKIADIKENLGIE